MNALPAFGRRGPVRVLEVGAGTGTVTRAIAARLGPGDRMEAVELNPAFVRMLTRALRRDAVLAPFSGQIRVIPESITELPLTEHTYDVIVSCLPFTNFPPDVVRSILERYLAALVPGGHLTYLGYLGTQLARNLVSTRAAAARHRAAGAAGLPYRSMAPYSLAAGAVWAFAEAGAGYAGAASLRRLVPPRLHGEAGLLLIAAAAVACAVLIAPVLRAALAVRARRATAREGTGAPVAGTARRRVAGPSPAGLPGRSRERRPAPE
nr:class I SAM-dependent methyltransferase [Streptomyces sp. NRRL B-1677]